ncbi:MAG: hypothetical protein WCV63_10375 [Negativicutes bacterium]|jgi:hypothetical protein
MRKIVAFLFLVIFFCSGTVAANKPVVNLDWNSYVFFAGDADKIYENYKLAAFDFGQTEATIKEWLQSAQKRGVLPFIIKDTADDDVYANNNQLLQTSNQLGIILLMTSDRTADEAYKTLGVIRSDFYCTYNMLICSADNSDGSLRILYSIPINAVSQNPLQSPINEPPTIAKKAAVFQELLKKSLYNQLEPKLEKIKLNNLETKTLTMNTYQVETVDMSSNKARALYGDQDKQIESMVSEWYSGWLAANDLLVYPPLCDGNWKGSATGGIFSMTVNSPSGSKIVSMQKANRAISLDISGINCKIVKTNMVEQQMIYKVWLSALCIPKFSREKDFSFYKSVITNAQDYDERDVYSMGLFVACQLSAEELAQKMR